MRLIFNKEIEFFIKKFFISEKYLLKKRLLRAYKNKYEDELLILDQITDKKLDSIDVGVYRGVYTFVLGKVSKHVHSFEPNPLLFPFLNKNLTKLVENMTLYNYALSNRNGEADLRVPKRFNLANKDNYEELYKLGCATIHEKNILSSEIKTFKVKTVKLDDVIENNKIGFIKIDVEGHEQDVLIGANNILKKNKPNLLVEIEERHSQEKVQSTINFINELGYKSYFLEQNKLLSTRELKNFRYKNNYIFLPM